ncbi:hypothetical protein [Streptomyces sp. NPDC097619]|uniref:hypothetical protein n=1 Tax=Streptomyces sp. NPDC097619 TaxID=3157228 RepID=UPI003323A761
MYGAAALSDFQQELLGGGLGALLGVLGTISVEYMRGRRDPVKQLSYDSETRSGIVSADDSVRGRLGFSYDGVPVDHLTSVQFTVENTGNQVVKDQQIRFRFKSGTRVLEADATSRTEREWGVRREQTREDGLHEAVFVIGHLERGQSVDFRLIVAGRRADEWEPIPHNPEGGVEFVSRTAARTKADLEHVPAAIVLCFLVFTLPPLFESLTEVGATAAALLRLGLLGAAAPHLFPAARALRDYLVRPEPEDARVHIGEVNGSAFSVLGSHNSATYNREPGDAP